MTFVNQQCITTTCALSTVSDHLRMTSNDQPENELLRVQSKGFK